MKYRRNAPLTDSQISALKGILAAHGAAAPAAKTNPGKKYRRKRRISAAHRRVLLKNLAKARRVKARKAHRRSRR